MTFEVVTRNIFLRECFFPMYAKIHLRKMEGLPADLKELICELPSSYFNIDSFVNGLIGKKFDSTQDIEKTVKHYKPIYKKVKLSIEDRSLIVGAETIDTNKHLHVPVAYIVELSD